MKRKFLHSALGLLLFLAVSSMAFSQPLAGTGAVTNVACYGACNGAIDLTITGGSTPYAFTWASGLTVEDLTGLCPGTYDVTVTDASGGGSSTMPWTYTNTGANQQVLVQTGTVSINGSPIAVGDYIGAFYLDGAVYECGGYALWNGDPSIAVTVWGDDTSSPDKDGFASNEAFTWKVWKATDGAVVDMVATYLFGTGFYLTNNMIGIATLTGTYIPTTAAELNLSFTITEPAELLVTSVLSDYSGYGVSATGATDGTIDLTIAGGSAPYTYTWSNSAMTQDLSGLGAGTYDVTVLDINGCAFTDSYVITEPPAFNPLSAVGTETNVSCNGTCNGAIDLTVSDGMPPYNFVWSNGATVEDLVGLCAGNYDVTVTDATGGGGAFDWTFTNTGANQQVLVQTGTVNINGSPIAVGDYIGAFYLDGAVYECGGYALWNGDPSIAVTVWGDDTSSPDKDGFATNEGFTWKVWKATDGAVVDMVATYLFGTGFYLTNNMIGIATLSGTYTPTVAAEVNLSFTITEPSPLGATAVLSDFAGYNVSVNGATDGSIDLTITGGNAPYTYTWSNGSSDQDLMNIGAGTYDVTVLDANGCAVYETYTLNEPPAIDPLAATGVVTDVNCNAACDGAIDLTVTGGLTPYNFAWSSGDTDEDLSNLCAGDYIVTITDGTGGSAGSLPWTFTNTGANQQVLVQTGTVSINGSPIVVGDYIGAFYLDGAVYECGGYALWNGDPSIAVTVWGDDTSSPDKDGFASNEAFTWKVWKAADGAVVDMVATYLFGAGFYTTNNMIGIATLTGSYIPPAAGFEVIDTFTVIEPDVLAITEMITNVACFGAATGAIDVTVSGGTPGYTYTWSNGETTEDLMNIGAGTYDVTVMDANMCEAYGSYTVTEATELMASAVSTNPACFMGLGSIDLTVSGGTAPYTFLWSNGDTTEDLIDIPENLYEVTITDANGCTTTSWGDLIAPDVVSISEAINDVLCYGDMTGAIDLTISGGVAPYSIAWDNGSNTEDLMSLAAGTYMVTVTDANMCEMTASYDVMQPDMLVGTEVVTNVSCYGGMDGAIDLSLTGGVAPYTYNWNSMYTTEDLSGLGEGTYEIIATDVNGCTFENFYTITQPDMLALSFVLSDYAGYNVSVFGAMDGTVDMTVAGGTAPFNFAWSNMETTEDLSGLAGGTYDVTVTDANMCEVTGTVTLTEPPAVDPITATFVTTDVTCAGGADGAIDMTPAGGWVPLTFEWSTGETTEDIMGLMAGMYYVTITDNSGDSIVEMVEVMDGVALVVNLGTDMTICDGQTYTLDAGTFATYMWSTNETTMTIDVMDAGTYSVEVTDANGCVASDEMVLTVNPVYNTTDMATICEGDVFTFGTQSLTTAGTYTEVFQSAQGCDSTVVLTLDVNPEPAVLFNFNGVEAWQGSTFEYCYNETVTVTLGTIASGTGPFDIAWEVNGVAGSASGLNLGDELFNDMLPVGTQTVQITSIVDANSCAVADVSAYNATVTINAEPAVLFNFNGVEVWGGMAFEYCEGEYVNATLGTIASGVAPFDIAWEVNGVAGSATGLNLGDALFNDMLPVGTHTVQITSIVDANACAVADVSVYNATVTINAEPAVLFNFNGVEVWGGMAFEYCEGEYVNATLGTIASGTGPFDISWEVNGVAGSATGINLGDALFNDMLPVGTHTVQITSIVDANSCAVADVSVYNATVTINAEPAVLFNFNGVEVWSGMAFEYCEGEYVNATLGTIATGVAPFDIAWEVNGVAGSATGLNLGDALFNDMLPVGVHAIQITSIVDANACAVADVSVYNATITINANPVVNLGADMAICESQMYTLDAGMFDAYMWSTSETTMTIDVMDAGTYSVEVTDMNGCMGMDEFVLTVNPLPVVSNTVTTTGGYNQLMMSGGSYTLATCSGDTISTSIPSTASLNPAACGELRIQTEIISTLPNIASQTVDASFVMAVLAGDQEISPINATTMVETITFVTTAYYDVNGDEMMDSGDIMADSYEFVLSVNPLPVVDLGMDQTVCEGETVTLDAGMFDAYMWSTGETTMMIDATMSGTYSVEVADMNGCMGMDEFVLTVNPLPAVDLGADMAICEGDMITLDAGMFDAYMWSTGETTMMIDVDMTGTYSVEVTDANGCVGMDEMILTVNPLPMVDLGADLYIYDGDVATLDAGIFDTYLWSTGETTMTIDVTTEGTYSVEVTDMNGCMNMDEVMVYIVPELTTMDLVESTDMSTWNAIPGDLATGYLMSIDPAVSYYYINSTSYTSTIALGAGMYGFTVATYPADWFTYWAARGVDVNSTTGWQAQMWEIINGNAPIFYLKIDAMGDATIVDGLQYDFAGIEDFLRVNGDYLAGMYTYTGMVSSASGVDSDPITVNWEFSGTAAAIQAAIDGTTITSPSTLSVMNGDDVVFDAMVDYPTFSVNLPQDLLTDALIELPTPLTAGAMVSIQYNGNAVGTYTVLGTETSIWLSEALGLTRYPLYSDVDATWTITISGLAPGMYDFNMTSISATAANFNDPANRYELASALTMIDVYTVAPDITNMTPADSSMLDGWVMLTVTTEDLDDEVTHLEVDVTKVGVQGTGATGGQWIQFTIPTDQNEIAQINAAYVGIVQLAYNAGVFSMNINTQAVANPFLDFPGWGDGEYIFWYIAYDEYGNQSGAWGDPSNPVDNIRYFIETVYDSQTFTLTPGYSIISTFIDPVDPDVAAVFGSLGLEVQLIKDENGNPYWPAFGLNNVGDMVIGEGYQIKMNSQQTIEIQGTQVVPEVSPIDLPLGWSLFGYLRTSPMDVAVALSTVAADINVVKTGSGLVYWPAFNYNSIGNLTPGVGYKARMVNAATLYYPANLAPSSKSTIVAPVNKVYTQILNTGADMTLGIPAHVWEAAPAIGDEVAVYTESGMLVGAGVYTGGNLAITIWGNDSETAAVDGMLEGTSFSIKLMRVAQGTEELVEITSWEQGNGLYADNAIAVAGKLTVAETAPVTQLFQNVPNPVKSTTEIRFVLAEESQVSVSIYNVLGEKLEILVSETMSEGEHTVIFNAENYAAGSYIYTIETPNFTQSKQMTIVR